MAPSLMVATVWVSNGSSHGSVHDTPFGNAPCTRASSVDVLPEHHPHVHAPLFEVFSEILLVVRLIDRDLQQWDHKYRVTDRALDLPYGKFSLIAASRETEAFTVAHTKLRDTRLSYKSTNKCRNVNRVQRDYCSEIGDGKFLSCSAFGCRLGPPNGKGITRWSVVVSVVARQHDGSKLVRLLFDHFRENHTSNINLSGLFSHKHVW